jgi:hypothetical protein
MSHFCLLVSLDYPFPIATSELSTIYLVDVWYYNLGPLMYFLPNSFTSFGFPICWSLAYLMKGFQKTRGEN